MQAETEFSPKASVRRVRQSVRDDNLGIIVICKDIDSQAALPLELENRNIIIRRIDAHGTNEQRKCVLQAWLLTLPRLDVPKDGMNTFRSHNLARDALRVEMVNNQVEELLILPNHHRIISCITQLD